VKSKNLDILKLLVDSGKADINFKDGTSRTPLMIAIVEDWGAGINYLKEQGATFKKSDIKKVPPKAGRKKLESYFERYK